MPRSNDATDDAIDWECYRHLCLYVAVSKHLVMAVLAMKFDDRFYGRTDKYSSEDYYRRARLEYGGRVRVFHAADAVSSATSHRAKCSLPAGGGGHCVVHPGADGDHSEKTVAAPLRPGTRETIALCNVLFFTLSFLYSQAY